MIPFKNKKKDANGKFLYEEWNGDGKQHKIPETEKQAVFVLGYKGYLQMAVRSSAYKNIIVTAVKRGELVIYNRITEEVTLTPIESDTEWEAAETIGYYAKIELTSGFEKVMYWSKEKMQIHTDRYSKAYDMKADKLLKTGQIPKKELYKYSSFWYDDFDAMAKKTMIRQIISGGWGVLSQELSDGLAKDNAVIQYSGGDFEVADIVLADGDDTPAEIEEAPQNNDETLDGSSTDNQSTPDNTETEDNGKIKTPSFDDL